MMQEEFYYIGLNANNAICNELFFNGSITLYPTGEKGNIYYSNTFINDTESDSFWLDYRNFIYQNVKKIQVLNPMAKFICFNDKIKKICYLMDDINIVRENNDVLIKFLNNKFEIRDFVKKDVPILDYHYVDSINYTNIAELVGNDKFVIQEQFGAGGDNTYLVCNQKDILKINNDANKYCVSKYVNNIPLNITMIIADNNIICFPISAQLIKVTNNKFKYVGGDFAYIPNIDSQIIDTINKYSRIIGNKVKKMGYRGIIGIDYILTEDNKIYFMEINPRFQSSSFMISLALEKTEATNIAKLHYLAMMNQKIDVKIPEINKSFVNCNRNESFDKIKDFQIIKNGYFAENKKSVYRKVLQRTVLYEADFEKI